MTTRSSFPYGRLFGIGFLFLFSYVQLEYGRWVARRRTYGAPVTTTAPPAEASIPIEDVLAVRHALVADDFATLEARLVWNVDSARLDPGYELRYRTAFDAFDGAAEGLRAHLDRWVVAEPRSSAALLARAVHSYKMGSDARGTAWSHKTSDAQFSGMAHWYEIAARDIRAARVLDPTNVLGYWLLLGIHPAGSDEVPAAEALEAGLRQVPGSALLHARYTYYLRPRWHGSLGEMDAMAERAEKAARINPRLRFVRGLIPYDSAETLTSAERYDAAIAMYTRAMGFGDYSMFRIGRADAYERAGEDERAIADYDTVLMQRSTLAEARASRARLHRRLAMRMRAGALRDARLRYAETDLGIAEELDPSDAAVRWARSQERRAHSVPAAAGMLSPVSADDVAEHSPIVERPPSPR